MIKKTQQVRTKRERLSLFVMPHFREHVARLVDTKKKKLQKFHRRKFKKMMKVVTERN
jgi:hypothetical protein